MAKLGEANIGGRMVPAWLLNLTAEELDSLKGYSKPNRNLWDNGYFVGGGSQSGYGNLPINQKGKQLYDQADGNCIDRHYKSSDAVVELLGDCLKITLKSNNAPNRFAHKFSTVFTSGITYTVSVLVKSVSNEVNVFIQESGGEFVTPVTGTISGTGVFSATFTCTKTAMYQAIFSNESRIDTELELMACSMHVGSDQLLAYSESDQWNLFETPDYRETLARCQRYFCRINVTQYSRLGYGVQALPSTQLILSIPLPQIIRENPAVTTNGTFEIEAESGNVALDSLTSFSAPVGIESCLLINVSTGVSGAFRARALSVGAYIDFNAEL